MKTHSEKFLRKRKFLLVLPILTLPFVTLAFWALGGGSGVEAQTAQQQQGLNKELPGAQNATGSFDKMSLYDLAAKDSAALAEQRRNDPYALQDTAALNYLDTTTSTVPVTSGIGRNGYADPNEAKVRDRLAQLERSLTTQSESTDQVKDPYTSSRFQDPSISGDLQQLQSMMQNMSGSNSGGDPEMQQLNSMLERILDIQHPGRVQEKLKAQSEQSRGQVFAVSTSQPAKMISSLDENSLGLAIEEDFTSRLGLQQTGFYSLNDPLVLQDSQNAIQAVIHETQTLTNGATVKLRLLNDIFINGVMIPKDNFLFGTAALQGERLTIAIDGIRYRNSLFPVNLSVYDLDGISGIYIPGAISREVGKESADRSMQNLGLTSLDPSWQAQAAGAGIEAAKSLFSKKVKLIRVTVKAGYKVLLFDQKQKQNN